MEKQQINHAFLPPDREGKVREWLKRFPGLVVLCQWPVCPGGDTDGLSRQREQRTHTCQVITGGWNVSLLFLTGGRAVLLFAGVLSVYNNMLWGACSLKRVWPVWNCSSTSPSSPLSLSCCAMLPLKRIMASLKLGSLNCGKLLQCALHVCLFPLYGMYMNVSKLVFVRQLEHECVYVSVFAWLQPNNNGPDSVEPRRLISHITEKIAAC